MVLHALHNGLLLSIVYYRHELMDRGWGIEEQEHLPMTWHAAAAVSALVAIGLLAWTARPKERPISES
jgi:hypothetical protein